MDISDIIGVAALDAFETEIGIVRGCVCHNTSFQTLRSLCDDHPDRVGEACKSTGCGSSCGLCMPYIQAAVRCKCDELEVMWSDDFAGMGIPAGRIVQVERFLAYEKQRGSESPPAEVVSESSE